MAAVRFLEVEAEPDGCQLSAPLLLTWRYTATEAIPAGWTWALTYVFDVAYDAREQRLGGCACAPCQPGSTHDAQASCDGIDTTGVPDSVLNNVGLLKLQLFDADGTQRACLSLVNQTEHALDGYSRRLITPPLDPG